MRRAALIGAVALLALPAAAAGAGPRASLPAIERQVMCVTCKIPLNVAESPQADRERAFIQTLIDKTDWKVLREKLGQLGDDCRKMLLLWADSYSDREIAALMEYKTADVVKTSRLRCLGKLRQLYQGI